MSDFPPPTPADAVHMLRAIRAFAADPHSDPPNSPAAGAQDCARQLAKIVQAGYLDTPAVLAAAGLSVGGVLALRRQLEDIEAGTPG